MAVDWSQRGEYIAKHEITPEQANEAHDDPDAVVFDPDYNSRTGESIRTIGYSTGKGAVLTVISVIANGVEFGASAWKSNSRDRRYYRQGGPDEGDA
ncbi:transposase [Mycolicibacterium holsaticum]|uniref:Transposase n=1 Tax=Mycolicibacterium holsaticum TaxID=152142 RepID=A0A1E3R658_9MYCO|nr:transposase [Mycolicibacterium holsaticum]ODQ84907.1 transposase [Mycolicibacterium holsaticum]